MAREKLPGNDLGLYSFLSRRGWPKSYSGKIFLVAFIGTHIPLITLFVLAIYSADMPNTLKARILLEALVATLIGTGLTLYALKRLLEPINMAFRALRSYFDHNETPELPTGFTDEVGVLMSDTTTVLKRLDGVIQRLANYDEATTLPNRNRCGEVLVDLRHSGSDFAVIVVQLDGLNAISSSLQPGEREQALAALAQRVGRFRDEGDFLARSSDDSFALVMCGYESLDEVENRVVSLLEAVSQPLPIGGVTWQVRAVAGIATAQDSVEAGGVLSCAESAAAEAKRAGAGEFSYFSAELTHQLRQRLALETEMARSLKENDFRLVFQPIVGVPSGQIHAVEALLRWNVEGRPVSPASFIPIAEESGQIVALGGWVLRTSCRYAQAWALEGTPVKVSVNVSPRQLRTQGFVAEVADALERSGLDPGFLQLEVTEGALVEDIESAIRVLQQLRSLGVSIALDDFGTGYSSLAYLKRLPIDVLKIDQSFVRGLPEDGDDLAIVRSIMALADSIGMAVVAEGVETSAQMECLIEEGCTWLQGYLFGKPMPAPDLVSHFSRGLTLDSGTSAA